MGEHWRTAYKEDPALVSYAFDADESFICDMAATLHVTCETCSNGSDFCLTILVDSMFLVDTGFSLEIVEDPCDDPVCAKKDKECTD